MRIQKHLLNVAYQSGRYAKEHKEHKELARGFETFQVDTDETYPGWPAKSGVS